ncbi:MAG: DUF4276 family protein [Thermoguttaceae bacterium]|jgi:hypothetical protein
MRLNLTVEGHTEQVFAINVLAPHLASYGVYLSKPRCTALCKKKGITHRGGLDTYLAFKNDIIRWLKQDSGSDVFFSTMIDLYALPNDFPGFKDATKLQNSTNRIMHLEKVLRSDIGDNRFVPYIQMHEYEALLLTEPESLLNWYPKEHRAVQNLLDLCSKYPTSEEIDDLNPPSKRIINEIPQYKGAKLTTGPFVAQKIGLTKLRDKCPHFATWITNLEKLGTLPSA